MAKSQKDNLIKLGDTLSVSPNIATSKTAAFGSNGSGKTYMVGKLNEELLSRGGWVIILDPVGIHWGLRLDESGKKPSGINIPIFGGQHGDVSLPSNSFDSMDKLRVARALESMRLEGERSSMTDPVGWAHKTAKFIREKEQGKTNE